jgi:hypothetical protein
MKSRTGKGLYHLENKDGDCLQLGYGALSDVEIAAPEFRD